MAARRILDQLPTIAIWTGVKGLDRWNRIGALFARHLICPDLKVDQGVWAEGVADRHIGCVPAIGDHDASDPWRVVAGIEHVPLVVEIHLKPAGEIHGVRVDGHADIAEVSGAVAGRDVGAAAQGQRQMGEIPTDADPFVEGFPGGAGVAGVVLPEADVLVHEVADGLDASPAFHVAELRPGYLGQPVGLAVAAAQQEQQGIVW